ncbi:FAD-dependent oxidoreductase [Haloglycomyces albus]|uniref:FAD-dependent oxidoreductase n=1 Tax=Haloglycomyces albus TaxID=526067 RepID=UPI00046D1C14|nr:FAD-dependent oxidoreductase [Haloglycomyces albus]
MEQPNNHPARTVAVIGAGPVGLAAAAHLVKRGITPIVLEKGDGPAAAVRAWGQVRLFSPWKFNIDSAAHELLDRAGWSEPEPDEHPTGNELAENYLSPLATLPGIKEHIRYQAEVVAVTRQGIDKTRTLGREGTPYLIRARINGGYEDVVADAVIDASGTWDHANPLGTGGLAVPGEETIDAHLAGPLPDVTGTDRERFAGKHTLVVGAGHSAANTILALVELADDSPSTKISWAIRSSSARKVYGGGDDDALPERGRLGSRLKEAVASGKVTLHKEFRIESFQRKDDRLQVEATGGGKPIALTVDWIAAATGFRPGLDMLREIRLDLDPVVEAPARLGEFIDPNFHSCGTVPPHGERELAHPDANFYLAGMKSYGRAPTFLLATGYEQVRSIVAALAGDREAADRVELQLPETGVCSTDAADEAAGDDDGCGTSCDVAPPSRGLATGVIHGREGDEQSESPEAEKSRDSCCS